MSGKYSKKHKTAPARNRQSKHGPRLGLTIAVAVLVIFAGVKLLPGWLATDPRPTGPIIPETTTRVPQTTAPVETTVPPVPETVPTDPVSGDELLDRGLRITDVRSYTGTYMEDFSDEVVSGVLAILVTNVGEEFIQLADITLTNGQTEAYFSLSTLMPGESVWVLEKNRMAYSAAPDFTRASLTRIAVFPRRPDVCADQLEIQCRDGVINITNISGRDIDGEIVIYYKNAVGGVYYGGITYRIRISGGLKAGEIRQGTAEHFNLGTSVIVFVTCG